MYLTQIPANVKTTTLVKIKYDCTGGFERCGKEWTLKHKDAKENFDKNGGKHVCRQCWLKNNNPAKKQSAKEKQKQTNLERYGATCVLNTQANIEKRVEQMFGSEEAVRAIVAKRQQTSQERYGVDHPMKHEAVKEKQQQVLVEKYGVRAPLQSEDIKLRMQQRNIEKYGVANVAQIPEVRAKMSQTTFERYGVEYYNQLPEMKEYLKNHCKDWLAESYVNGGPNKGITRPQEWNEKQSRTVADLILSGNWKVGPKYSLKGNYKAINCKKENPMFRSSYELMTHFFLDHHDDVEYYDYEPFRVPYLNSAGEIRHYIPDFLVKWKSKNKIEIIEVKSNYLLGLSDTTVKLEGAKRFFDDNNFTYTIWGIDRIKQLDIDIEELLDLPAVNVR